MANNFKVDYEWFIEELPEEDTWEYMHSQDGVYVHRHREVQREVRVYSHQKEKTYEGIKRRKII